MLLIANRMEQISLNYCMYITSSLCVCDQQCLFQDRVKETNKLLEGEMFALKYDVLAF